MEAAEDHRQGKTVKQKSVRFNDQLAVVNLAEYDELPPAYSEVCPQFVPRPLSPILDEDTGSVVVPETVMNTILSTPPVSTPLVQMESQTEPSKQVWTSGIILIIFSCLTMIVALPCGILALLWSISAYYENNPLKRRRAVFITVAMNIFVIVFVIVSISMLIWALNNNH